jgi:hypothetical protein
MTQPETTKPNIAYCPKCYTRYTTGAEECVTCKVTLEAAQPHDASTFKPSIDIPFVALAVLFAIFFKQLPGEAQSFGFIFLLVGFLTIITFRLIDHAEWLGRR